MFEIKYRIVDDICYLKELTADEFDMEKVDIEGFIWLNFNGNSIGFYHDHSLAEGEFGCELLVTWFEGLLNVLKALETSDNVALPLIGRFCKYLEFKKVDQYLTVSIVEYERKPEDEQYLLNSFKKEFKYPEWKDISISKDQFLNEVLNKASDLIASLTRINPDLYNSKTLIKMTNKIDEIKRNKFK